jgi:hypothetical protein
MQIVLLVESARVDGITGSLGNVEQKNGWKVKPEVIMSTKKEEMFFPPSSNLRIAESFLKNHISLP